MAVGGGWLLKNSHHRNLGVAHRSKIAASNDFRDATGDLINSRGEVIGDEPIGAAQHDIAAGHVLVWLKFQPPGRQSPVQPTPAVLTVPAGAWIAGNLREVAATACLAAETPARP